MFSAGWRHHIEDMQSGYEKNICIKTSKRHYLMAKNLVVALSGFASVSLPLALDLFIMAGLYPNWKPEKLTFLCAGIIDIKPFAELYNTYPALYALVFNRKYSLGMKQKLGIANAIMGEPDFIVLDEPINALDEESVKQVKEVLLVTVLPLRITLGISFCGNANSPASVSSSAIMECHQHQRETVRRGTVQPVEIPFQGI